MAAVLASALGILFSLTLLNDSAFAVPGDPPTSTIRIRLKGPTLRVRCRGGDCVVSVVRTGTQYAVSVTRTRRGEQPFTFAKTVDGPTNLAIETGIGNDYIQVVGAAVPGFMRVASGLGNDVIDLQDTSAAGKAAIDTGAGDDALTFAPGVIGGKFHLTTKSGNDTVAINGGVFGARAGLDGGVGTDTLSALTATFGESPVVRGFEP